MTFRSICIAVYVFFYLIFTTPERIRLKKLEQTDPQEASRIAQEHVQKVFRHLLKISGVTIEVNGLEDVYKRQQYILPETYSSMVLLQQL